MVQDSAEIRREIIRVLLEMNRPASCAELGAACYARNRIGGTRLGVGEIVSIEVGMMIYDGVLKLDGLVPDGGLALVSISDVLTAMIMAVETD